MAFSIFKKRVTPTTTPVWDNDLIMCPSQCYCYFETLGNKYCIYLRWRWDEPWSAQVVPCDENWEFDYDSDWRELDVPFITHDDYKRLQKRCVKKVVDIFDNVKWRKNELDG